jgi:hypothetical protein
MHSGGDSAGAIRVTDGISDGGQEGRRSPVPLPPYCAVGCYSAHAALNRPVVALVLSY